MLPSTQVAFFTKYFLGHIIVTFTWVKMYVEVVLLEYNFGVLYPPLHLTHHYRRCGGCMPRASCPTSERLLLSTDVADLWKRLARRRQRWASYVPRISVNTAVCMETGEGPCDFLGFRRQWEPEGDQLTMWLFWCSGHSPHAIMQHRWDWFTVQQS